MNDMAFTFDDVSVAPMYQIGKHSHPQWELSHVIYGSGERTIGNLTEPMTEGEIILIPPNISHVWQFDPTYTDSNGNIANISIFFDTSTINNLTILIPEIANSIKKLISLTEAINLKGESYLKVYDLLMAMRSMTPDARVPKMMELLLTLANADGYRTVGRNNTRNRIEERLEKIRIFCSCNYVSRITLDEMATYTGMNKSAFCTFMRRYAGMTLSEFINDIRLKRAMDMLLHTDKNISDIAYDTGFSNATYFNRLFRKKYNCTPKSVRSEKR